MNHEVLDKVFQALSHSTRRDIIDLVSKQPLTTGEICQNFDVSRYAIMKHLNILEDAQLVITRRRGREKINYFHAIPLQETHRRWINRYQSQNANSMINLQNLFKQTREDHMMMNSKEEQSFQIAQEIKIMASKEDVYRALTNDINQWWSIRLFEQSELAIDQKLGGYFYEKTPDGKQALWGTVVFIKPHEEIHLNGSLGMPGAVHSYYTYKLEETHPNETILSLDHTVFGIIDPVWESQYEEGWDRLLRIELKEFVENNRTL